MGREEQPAWYDSALLLFCASTAIAIVLTVFAAVLKDLRWLLFFAWPFATVAIWEFARTRGSKRLTTWLVGGAIISGSVVAVLYWRLAPDPAETMRTALAYANAAVSKSWFHWLGGILIGLSAGTWLAASSALADKSAPLRNRAAPPPAPLPVPERSSLPPGKRFIPPDWDAPLVRVIKEHYKNETVDLDGKELINCTFEDISFRYQGERPFRVIDCAFLTKNNKTDVTLFSDNPIVGEAIRLFELTGALKNPGTFRVTKAGSR